MSVLFLPPDLLENILVLVVRSSLFPGRTALDISHVCSLWRKAALGCPRLWGIIDTRNKKISSLFVSRTRKSTPLDVLVANPYIAKPPSLFSKDDVLRGHPPRRKEGTHFSFETVLSCLHNIRFLTLYLSYQELRLFSAVFPSTGMELQLASLTIITTPTWDANGSNSLDQARIATLVPSVFMKPLLLQGHKDCDDDGGDDDVACSSMRGSYLKSLTLTDISLPWGEISASLCSLTYLALTSPALRPSLKQIHLILRRTTLLKRLVLDDVFEDAVLDLHSVNSPDCDSLGPGPLRDLSPIFLPHLTSLTYNAPSLQAHWLCLLLSNCIVAPLLDNISFRTPEMGHLYRPVGEECRPLTAASPTPACKCWMFDPSKLIPKSNVTKKAFLGGLARSIDHLMVSRDAYNPIRSGKGRGYRFYIHGAAKNIDAVEYPSLIPFLRAPSVPFHDPRYFRKFERGILLSGYAYACPHFASRIVPSSFSLNQKNKDTYTYTCPNPISALISGFESLAVNLVHVRHLELATGGVEVLLMDRVRTMAQDLHHDGDEGVLKRNALDLYKSGNQQDIAYRNKKPLGAVRHVTLWGQISSANSECNVYWRGSDIEKIPLSSSQPGCLYLTDVLYLLKNRLAIAQNRQLRVHNHSSSAGEESASFSCISEPPLITRLTLRHFKVEFTPELNEAIESLLGCCYDVLHVDLKKRCEQVISAKGTCAYSDEGGKLELIDCSSF